MRPAQALSTLAAEVTGADVTLLVERDGAHLEPRGHYHLRAGFQFAPMHLQVSERQAETFEPHIMQEAPAPRRGAPAQSGLSVPVVARGQCWGHLVLGYQVSHQIRPPTVELAGGLASLFGLLLGSAAGGDDILDRARIESPRELTASEGT